jgi:hypothetical protein
MGYSQVLVIFAGEGHGCRIVHLLPVLLEEGLVDLGLGGSQSGGSSEFLWRTRLAHLTLYYARRYITYQSRVSDKLAGQPQEGLLEVVVGLG